MGAYNRFNTKQTTLRPGLRGSSGTSAQRVRGDLLTKCARLTSMNFTDSGHFGPRVFVKSPVRLGTLVVTATMSNVLLHQAPWLSLR